MSTASVAARAAARQSDPARAVNLNHTQAWIDFHDAIHPIVQRAKAVAGMATDAAFARKAHDFASVFDSLYASFDAALELLTAGLKVDEEGRAK